MAKSKDSNSKLYYFIDIDAYSRQIVAWDIEPKDQVVVNPKNGCHRVFLSRGQYNKLIARIEEARS